MLRQRIITALVLLLLFSVTLWLRSPWPFWLLTIALISAGAWEWMRLNPSPSASAPLLAAAVMAIGCGSLISHIQTGQTASLIWALASVAWVVGVALALRLGASGWTRLALGVRWALGALLLGLAWLALVQARARGINFLMSVLCLVWVADIAAYFGGRAFGRRKLAPTISPGKSWEGVYSGALGVLILAVVWLLADRHWSPESKSLYSLIYQSLGVIGLAASVALLTTLSVAGDLFESLIKRAAGAKDSSQLLPGHGGVLDRVDALLPVLPVAMALASC